MDVHEAVAAAAAAVQPVDLSGSVTTDAVRNGAVGGRQTTGAHDKPKRESASSQKATRGRTTKPDAGTGRASKLEQDITGAIGGIGLLLMPFQPFDGTVVLNGAPELAKQLDELARRDPKIKAALERALTGSAWAGIIGASVNIALPILAYHNLLPTQLVLFTEAGRAAADATGLEFVAAEVPTE